MSSPGPRARAHGPEDGRLRVLVAPCGFKEGLSVMELVDCMARGVAAAAPEAEILRAPMADGGEGFTRTLVALTGGSLHPTAVTGPVGQRLDAEVGLLGGRHRGVAVLEIAAAAGLRHVPGEARDPRRTTSYGVGELIRAALDLGAKKILVGCGDSGVNDGGIGLAQALGVRLLDRDGRPLGRGGDALRRLARIDLSARDPRIAQARIEVAVNWKNRLLGKHGVARVYGPQKGASPEAVAALEEGLANLAAAIRHDLGIEVAGMSGAGASGGLGAGLHAFLRARLVPRFQVVSRFVDLDRMLARCDLVLTAEGRIDRSTSCGKLPAEVARRAKRYGVPVVALVGTVGEDAGTAHAVGIDAYFSILSRPCSSAAAMKQAPQLVAQAAEQVTRFALACRRNNPTAQRAKSPAMLHTQPGKPHHAVERLTA